MKPIHIIHVMHSLSLGGMESIVVNLINGLDRKKFVSSLCCLEGLGPLLKEINQREVKVFNLGKGESHDWTLFLRLAKLFKKEGAQIVHTLGWAALFDGIIGARIARVPVVVHSEHGKSYEDLLDVPRRRIWTQRMILPYLTDKVCVVCEDLKKSLKESLHLLDKKMITIYNGIEISNVALSVDLVQKKKDIGYKNNEMIVGTVGRLDPVKNYKVLLRSAAIITQDMPNVKFLFVGDGPAAEGLKSLTQELGLNSRVIFLGQREDVPELLKIMDVFALPSLSEGLSKAILEAMAAGLPVVATNVGGNPELVIENQTGFLVPSGDPQGLANAIIYLLKNHEQAKRMGMSGQEMVRQHFSLEKMIKSYENLYLSLLTDKGWKGFE